ncbi:hemolysin family protein [Bdellovibrionota bacterium FG-1]
MPESSLTLTHLLTLVPPLLLIEGFYSGSEIALLSADKLALKRQARQGSHRAGLAIELAAHPERIFSATLLLTSLCVIVISALTALFFLERHQEHSDLLAILVTSPLVVILGELIPKTLYQRNATLLAPWVALPIHWTYWIFYPLTRILSLYTSKLSRMIGPIEELLTGKHHTTREDLESLLSYNRRESDLKLSEKQMIRRILDFRESMARNALIPLVQVDAIEDTATVREALEQFERHRHSRMPVYHERIDNIVGVLETADLFVATDLDQPVRHYVTSAHYVAETQALPDLLLEMHREDDEMVVVVDEHGGAVGVITFEDIAEEIVGEINDEYDTESLPYKELSAQSWLVQARMEIPLINEQLNFELPQGEYETLSGFLLQQFGRIPEHRDELFFNTPRGQFKFTIRKATARHIELVLIEKIAESTSEG